MENIIISRTEYQNACDTVDDVSGTVSVVRCTENNASRLFPSDPYLEYLDWLNEWSGGDDALLEIIPIHIKFERYVNRVFSLLEDDGSLYIPDYRTFLTDKSQIMNAINLYFGMSWVFSIHVVEAIRRKRENWHE